MRRLLLEVGSITEYRNEKVYQLAFYQSLTWRLANLSCNRDGEKQIAINHLVLMQQRTSDIYII